MAKKDQNNAKGPIPKELFDILACPLCKADLEYTNGRKGLLCSGCGATFPIKEGIPVLMPKK
ncbi:Trm112 family protein [Candidatus Woesearchaeota archaeon]|nr:Trm112 family protein [Candidatus Woesearchaeota archaeon]